MNEQVTSPGLNLKVEWKVSRIDLKLLVPTVSFYLLVSPIDQRYRPYYSQLINFFPKTEYCNNISISLILKITHAQKYTK